jgi:uncharacterized protein YndB with AHSA1/START domain/uncharacterized protein YciI
MTSLPSIRREILVEADPDWAFSVFTDRIGQWWPLHSHGCFGGDSTVAFEDGLIVETSTGGERAVWGEVTKWEPGRALAFTWHPGQESENSSAVEVTFVAQGGRTLVRLEHGGWEVYADPEGTRSEHGNGWPFVLDRYQDDANTSAVSTWVALLHRPGPDAPLDVFSDPRFAEHVAFLNRMHEAGYLVAAGPLSDEAGAGMTVLRLPGSGRYDEAVSMATQDDGSVRAGLFSVTTRPWQVIMH